MAYDKRLIEAGEKWGDAMMGVGDEEQAFLEYVEVLKVVAVERGDSVIELENPYYAILDNIYDEDYEPAGEMIDQFKVMIKALEDVGYSRTGEWKKQYEDVVKCSENMHDRWQIKKGERK